MPHRAGAAREQATALGIGGAFAQIRLSESVGRRRPVTARCATRRPVTPVAVRHVNRQLNAESQEFFVDKGRLSDSRIGRSAQEPPWAVYITFPPSVQHHEGGSQWAPSATSSNKRSRGDHPSVFGEIPKVWASFADRQVRPFTCHGRRPSQCPCG